MARLFTYIIAVNFIGGENQSTRKKKKDRSEVTDKLYQTNCNQTLVEWSLDGPLSKLCPVIPTSNQDGRQAKNRKKGG
jgi:hypothetical protein